MVHEISVQYLTVQADTWQCKQFCWSKIWRSRKCHIRFAMDLRQFESQEWSRTGVINDRHIPKIKNFNSVCYSTFVLNFTELITHPALVNFESFSIAEHISIALPKELWLKTDSKPFRVILIFLIHTAPIPNNVFTFHSEPHFESQFHRPLIKQKF